MLQGIGTHQHTCAIRLPDREPVEHILVSVYDGDASGESSAYPAAHEAYSVYEHPIAHGCGQPLLNHEPSLAQGANH